MLNLLSLPVTLTDTSHGSFSLLPATYLFHLARTRIVLSLEFALLKRVNEDITRCISLEDRASTQPDPPGLQTHHVSPKSEGCALVKVGRPYSVCIPLSRRPDSLCTVPN